jgi:hypothetical protein
MGVVMSNDQYVVVKRNGDWWAYINGERRGPLRSKDQTSGARAREIVGLIAAPSPAAVFRPQKPEIITSPRQDNHRSERCARPIAEFILVSATEPIRLWIDLRQCSHRGGHNGQ